MLNTSIHILIKLPPQMSYKSTFMITSSPKKQQKPNPEMEAKLRAPYTTYLMLCLYSCIFEDNL